MENGKERKSWDHYFMEIARSCSTRATCDRLHVGCVIVRDKVIISTGYNGSISGMPHCDDVGHDLDHGHCVATIHAEMNAICIAAKNGHSLKDCTAYITHYPCWICYKMLVQSGITKIVYGMTYGDTSRVDKASKEKDFRITLLGDND